jgi:O-antigen/teichoic acid export membrane protein
MLRSIIATAGHQRFVGVVELLGATLSVLLGITLVSQHGWRGAVLATYGTHALMSLAVTGFAILRWRRRDGR